MKLFVKRTVSVVSYILPCKDGNARFTTVPFKALSKYELDINVYYFESFDYFQLRFFYKSDLRIYTAGKHTGMIRIKQLNVEKCNIFHIIG